MRAQTRSHRACDAGCLGDPTPIRPPHAGPAALHGVASPEQRPLNQSPGEPTDTKRPESPPQPTAPQGGEHRRGHGEKNRTLPSAQLRVLQDGEAGVSTFKALKAETADTKKMQDAKTEQMRPSHEDTQEGWNRWKQTPDGSP